MQKITNIVAEVLHCPVDQLNENTNIVEDLKADSLDTMELVMKLEDEFSISIADHEYSNITTIKDIDQLVKDKLSKKT